MQEGEYYLIRNNVIVYIDNFLNNRQNVNIKIIKAAYIKDGQPFTYMLESVLKRDGRQISKNVVDKLRKLL